MVNFAQLQQAMKERLESDRAIHTVEVEGASPEEAVVEAATLLGVPVKYIEYEVLDRQISFLGIGKNFCRIAAYEREDYKNRKQKEELRAAEESASTETASQVEVVIDRDGDVFLQIRSIGEVYLKVTSPQGKGKPATEDMALSLFHDRNIEHFDTKLVKQTIRDAAGEYVKVGTMAHNIANDTTVGIEIADDDMFAYMYVTPPRLGGIDFSYEDYVSQLSRNGINFGIKEDFLREFADRPTYNEQVCVAEGQKPVDGANAYVDYYFNVSQGKVRLVESQTGQVDFKQLNIIQNVFKDQKLAKKIAAEKGEDGTNVRGQVLFAQDGKDVTVALGKNVHLDTDGVTILADINGQVVLSNGKINVEEVLTIDGSVGIKTGNIIFVGTVAVGGNVEEGFSIKATGNIEINGTVDKADLEAEGDIIVRQGIAGKPGSLIKSGKSVWAKFIENATVKSGSMVVASDSIVNSQIDAKTRILCDGGKRATIIGGRLRASEEISSKNLGSAGGNTETICEVGFDPERKEQLDKLFETQNALTEQYDDVVLNLQTLENIRLQRGSLPEDKELYLEELTQKKIDLVETINQTKEDIEQLQQELNSLKTQGRISASAKAFAGVTIGIRELRETINSDYKAVSFVYEAGLIRSVPYIEPQSGSDTSGGGGGGGEVKE